MTLAGGVRVDARWCAGRLSRIDVQLQRPQLLALLQGQAASAVIQLVPQLYAVCARAQSAAATAALAAAAGAAPGPRVDRAVAEEAVRELLLSMLDGAERAALVPALREHVSGAGLRGPLTRLLGRAPASWLRMSTESELRDWAGDSEAALAREARRRLALPEVRPVPTQPLGSAQIEPLLATAGAASRLPLETGALARGGGHALSASLVRRPLLQRWVARLIELLQHAEQESASALGRVSVWPCAAGRGVALVETARGLLLHDLTMQDGRVRAYRVLAPTDVNFTHPGVLSGWLRDLPCADPPAALELVQRAAQALDPCVPVYCRVEEEAAAP